LTQNTQIGTSSWSLSFVGLGGTQALFIGLFRFRWYWTTNPLVKLQVTGVGLFSTLAVGATNMNYSLYTNSNARVDTNLSIGGSLALPSTPVDYYCRCRYYSLGLRCRWFRYSISHGSI